MQFDFPSCSSLRSWLLGASKNHSEMKFSHQFLSLLTRFNEMWRTDIFSEATVSGDENNSTVSDAILCKDLKLKITTINLLLQILYYNICMTLNTHVWLTVSNHMFWGDLLTGTET